MSIVEGEGGPIDPPPSRLHVTIFSSRLLGLLLLLTFRTEKQFSFLSALFHLTYCKTS